MNQNTQWGAQAEYAEGAIWKQEFSGSNYGERLMEDSEPWWYDEK